VLIKNQVFQAKGFYVLTMLNGSIYAIIAATIVIRHVRDNRLSLVTAIKSIPLQLAMLPIIVVLTVHSVVLRGPESLLALSVGIGQDQMVRYEYVVSGAGMGDAGTVRFHWNKEFLRSHDPAEEE